MIEFKFSDFFYPKDLLSAYILLRGSEHWSHRRFEEYQSQKLAKLLRYCAIQVPYYQETFSKINLSVDDIHPSNALELLHQLPILDKNTLRANPELFISRQAQRFQPKAVSTSGTTGTPLTVYWDHGSNVMEFASIQRLWRWAGFRIGQPFLDLRSRSIDDDERHLVIDGKIRYVRNWKVNGLEFSSDLIDESNIQKYYELLLRYKPNLLRGHPQAIDHLARLLQDNGLHDWRPKAVTTASEALYDFQRQQILKAWGIPVLDSYGLKEHNVFIAQCPNGGYHISPEYGVCEILDDDGNQVASGQEGWIVATGLHNFAQPLLRYNTLDRAVAAGDRVCSCGRTLPLVERIVGRIDDCIYTEDGRRYSGLSFAFFDRSGLRKARLIQENYQNVIVEMVITNDFSQAEKMSLIDTLEKKVEHKI